MGVGGRSRPGGGLGGGVVGVVAHLNVSLWEFLAKNYSAVVARRTKRRPTGLWISQAPKQERNIPSQAEPSP